MIGKRAARCLSDGMRGGLFALLLLMAAPVSAQTLNRGNGAEPDSLDPQFVGGTAEENILDDEPIAAENEEIEMDEPTPDHDDEDKKPE